METFSPPSPVYRCHGIAMPASTETLALTACLAVGRLVADLVDEFD